VRSDDLRSNLGEYLQRTRNGESFTITRRGRVVTRLMPPDSGPPEGVG
jgi:prevent-host-death family protein